MTTTKPKSTNSEGAVRSMLRAVALVLELAGAMAIAAAAFLVDWRLGLAVVGTLAIAGAQLVDRFADTIGNGTDDDPSHADPTE